MNSNLYSQVHFFETLRDTVVSRPYVILCSEEVNSLIHQIETLAKGTIVQCAGFEYACALLQSVYNARGDGYFPIVVLPQRKYQAARSFLEQA